MTATIPAHSLHEFYNEKLRIQAKNSDKLIEQLNIKIENLKTETMLMRKINQSLTSKLHSANNMIRILTTNRELDYDIRKADHFINSKLIENNINLPKKADAATTGAKLLKVQNKYGMQRRNVLKPQNAQVTSTNNIVKTQNQKVKPPVNNKIGDKPSATQTRKMPIPAKPANRNLENNNKENAASAGNTTAANRKAELAGVKSGAKKSNLLSQKKVTFTNRNVTENRLKKVEKDRLKKEEKITASETIPPNKTFVVHK